MKNTLRSPQEEPKQKTTLIDPTPLDGYNAEITLTRKRQQKVDLYQHGKSKSTARCGSNEKKCTIAILQIIPTNNQRILKTNMSKIQKAKCQNVFVKARMVMAAQSNHLPMIIPTTKDVTDEIVCSLNTYNLLSNLKTKDNQTGKAKHSLDTQKEI